MNSLTRRDILKRTLTLTGAGLVAACSKPAAAPTGARRIVSLSPALSIILRDLGCAQLIVGRHGYEMVLDPSVPVCGDQSGLDYEAIHKAAPTHVLTQFDSGDVPPKLLALAASEGFTATNYRLLTLEEIRTVALQLAATFGGNGDALAGSMDRAFVRRGAGFAAVGRVMLLAETQPVSILGPGSFHHQILSRIGGNAVPTSGAPFITLDTEDIMQLAPDAIVMILPRGRSAPAARDTSFETLIRLIPTLASRTIPAIINRRLALIDDPLAQIPSTALIGFADQLAQVLGGWRG